jgi:type IV secretory pathway VirB10-like protein
MPALISLASFGKTEKSIEKKQKEAHPNVNMHDAKAITGTEHFPETYSDVKGFEKEIASKNTKEEPIIQALAQLEEQAPFKRHDLGYQYSGYGGGRDDDPWKEAAKQEQKQRASDHYDSRRSDIMFINNVRDRREESQSVNKENDIPQGDTLIINNNEDPHRNFLAKRGPVGQIKNPSQFMLSEGTLIHAILLSEINTDLPGPILARVSHNIWDSKTGQTLLIPQNSKLIGEYNSTVGHGQNRAQIVWTRIIYPNQQSIDLGRMVGVDKKVTSGTAGAVNNHYDKIVMALFMTTSLSAGVKMTQGKYDPNTATIGQDLGNSLAQETARFGSRIADKALSIKPTITVPIGERLNVFVEQDLHLEPYSG